MREHKHIYDLVEKFLEGRTSNAEERELYAWFRENEVPAEWQELKAMFEWYEEGMPEREAPVAAIVPTPTKRHLWLRWGTACGIAASVAIIIMLFSPNNEALHTSNNIYEGSYIVEQGIRYSDIEHIEDDIEELLERADAIELKADELIAWAEI
jgi:hypothetical protein